MFPFFGLGFSYKKIFHSEIFNLVFHGQGGFSWIDVYNMPVWLRNFYISKIVEFKKEEQKAYDKEVARIKSHRK